MPGRYNQVEAMEAKLADISYPDNMHWVQRMDVTSAEPVQINNIEDDAERELAFYKQALDAVNVGRAKLAAFGIPIERPEDYFAEMVKTDEHMRKVRQRLIEERESIEKSEAAKKQRELKKFGKQVQTQILQERAQQKNANLDAVKKLRKGRAHIVEDGDEFDITVDDADARGQKRGAPGQGGKNFKRIHKDKKFGFGGKKRHAKSNTADSASDMKEFAVGKMKASFKGMPAQKKKSGAGSKKQRPGKARRQQMKRK